MGIRTTLTALIASWFMLSSEQAIALAAAEATPGENAIPKTEDAAPDTGLDPTILNSQIALTNEFKNQEMGASKNITTLNLAYAFGNPVRHDWTAQLDLPLVYYDAGQRTGGESGTGIGDVEVHVGHVLRSEGIFRYAVGVETEFDTAGGPPRGDGIFRISPIFAFVIEPCTFFKFQTFAQFNQALRTETGVPEKQEIDLKPPITFNLPSSWYVYTEFEEKWELDIQV